MSNKIKPEEEEDEVFLETLVETVYAEFDDIAEIHVDHLQTASEFTQLIITVHTVEAESYEEWLDIAPASHVSITTDDGITFRAPYSVLASYSGPGHINGPEGTTVYTASNVLGSEPRDLSEGLRILQQKLSGFCPTCGESSENLRQHYHDQRKCAEAEMK